MSRMRKIILKVLRGDTWEWVHFCYIQNELYEKFFEVTKCEKSAFGTFLSMWVKGDFGINLKMTTYDDIIKLRHLIQVRYTQEYPELYILDAEENPRIQGWVRMWVSQHMRVEIAARKETSNV